MSKARNDQASRDRRKAEATTRNERWAALTPANQIKELDKLKLVATKQRAKIAKAL